MTNDNPPAPLAPIVLAWLVPGAGHLKLGRPWPALFIAASVIPLFVLGMFLTGWENVSWTRHPFYFGLQAPAGLIAVAGEFLTRDIPLKGKLPHASVGTLFSAVAGLLNLMAIADVWARTMRGDPIPESASADEASAASPDQIAAEGHAESAGA